MSEAIHSLSREERETARLHIELLKRLGISEPVIFDVGAHVGSMSALYLEEIPSASIVAFEPDTATFRVLRENLTERVTTRNVALGETEGEIMLNYWADSTVASLLPAEPELVALSKNYVGEAQQVVRMSTLDHEVARLGVQPDFLKIDVQGYELGVLRGGEALLTTGGISVVACEFNVAKAYVGQTDLGELLVFMKSRGFNLWSIDRMVAAKAGNLYFGDLTFVSREAFRALGAL